MSVIDYNLPYLSFMRELEKKDYALERRKYNVPAKEGYFRYIPNRNESLTSILLRVRENGGTFLDVGCGTGRVLALARYLLGMKVIGIECIEKVAKAGMKAYDVPIIVGDAFDIVNQKWMADNNITVVYTYMPISNALRMTELHLHLFKSLAHRSVRIEMLPRYLGVSEYDRPLMFDQYPTMWEGA